MAADRRGAIGQAGRIGGDGTFRAVVMLGNRGSGGATMRQRGFRGREHERESGQDQH